MKAMTKAYLHMQNTFHEPCEEGNRWKMRWGPVIYGFKAEDAEDIVFIREMKLEVEIPDDFDPVPKQVKALEKLKLEALEKYQKDVAEINERLNKLLALTNEVQ